MIIAQGMAIVTTVSLASFVHRMRTRDALLTAIAMPAIATIIMTLPFLILDADGQWRSGPGAKTLEGIASFEIMPVAIAASVLAIHVFKTRFRSLPNATDPVSAYLSLKGTLTRSAYTKKLINIGLLFGSVIIWTVMMGVIYVDSERRIPPREGYYAHMIMALEWAVTGLVASVILAMQRLRETKVPHGYALLLPFCIIAGILFAASIGSWWPFFAGCAAYIIPVLVPRRTTSKTTKISPLSDAEE